MKLSLALLTLIAALAASQSTANGADVAVFVQEWTECDQATGSYYQKRNIQPNFTALITAKMMLAAAGIDVLDKPRAGAIGLSFGFTDRAADRSLIMYWAYCQNGAIIGHGVKMIRNGSNKSVENEVAKKVAELAGDWLLASLPTSD